MDVRSEHIFADTNGGEGINGLDHLVWQIWHELDGRVSRARVCRVALQMAAVFRDAPVTTHIAPWVRHLTREWLKVEIARPGRKESRSQKISPVVPARTIIRLLIWNHTFQNQNRPVGFYVQGSQSSYPPQVARQEHKFEFCEGSSLGTEEGDR